MNLLNFEDFLNEAVIQDPAVQQKISHFYELQQRIEVLEATLKKEKQEMEQFSEEIKPLLDSMKETGDRLATTEEYIIQITRFSSIRKDASYKAAFENALTKVNDATRKVLEDALEASRKVTETKHSYKIKPVVENSMWDKIKNSIKDVVKNFLNVFKKESAKIDDANKELKDIAKKK